MPAEGDFMKIGMLATILVLSSIVLTACGTINITQKIHRDATYDLSIDVQSDNEAFLNLMKSGFEESMRWTNASYIETEKGFKYQLENGKISASTDENVPFFQSMGIKKTFHFPYHYYTLTYISEGMNNTSDSEFNYGATMSMNYIIEPFGKITDTNGIYIGEDKKQVKFDLTKSKEYYVTFRDIFFASWFSGARNFPEKNASTNSFKTQS